MSNQLANISSCGSCDAWNAGDGNNNIAWNACSSNNGNLVPTPSWSDENGFYDNIPTLQDALNKGYTQSLGACSGLPDPNLSSEYQDCENCYTDGIKYKPSSNMRRMQGMPGMQGMPNMPTIQRENFLTGFVEPGTRPTCYLNMGQTWSVQKPYTL